VDGVGARVQKWPQIHPDYKEKRKHRFERGKARVESSRERKCARARVCVCVCVWWWWWWWWWCVCVGGLTFTLVKSEVQKGGVREPRVRGLSKSSHVRPKSTASPTPLPTAGPGPSPDPAPARGGLLALSSTHGSTPTLGGRKESRRTFTPGKGA
jgi:hypothetical protein